MVVTRPALRYHGAKWLLAPWIMAHFPPHRIYVEPFGGSFAVGLQKTPTTLDVWNDLNGYVAAFFRVLRDRPADLIGAITLTPYHRDEALEAERRLEARDVTDELEIARLLYVQSWQTFGGVRDTRTSSGYRFDVAPTNKTNVGQWNDTQHLWGIATRLKLVQFESSDALHVVERYGRSADALLYVDPPYVTDTRGGRWQSAAYSHELNDDDHVRLAQLLHEANAHVVLSGYPSALYEMLYAGWQCVERQTRTQGRSEATERLWIAPSPDERRALWAGKHVGRLTLQLDVA